MTFTVSDKLPENMAFLRSRVDSKQPDGGVVDIYLSTNFLFETGPGFMWQNTYQKERERNKFETINNVLMNKGLLFFTAWGGGAYWDAESASNWNRRWIQVDKLRGYFFEFPILQKYTGMYQKWDGIPAFTLVPFVASNYASGEFQLMPTRVDKWNPNEDEVLSELNVVCPSQEGLNEVIH